MRIRYPITTLFTIILALGITSLAVVWSLIHIVGLVVVVAALFFLPVVARWEDQS